MNDKLNAFVKNIGVLCEIWILIYKKFTAQGMSNKEAMAHTQCLMTALMSGDGQNNGGINEVS